MLTDNNITIHRQICRHMLSGELHQKQAHRGNAKKRHCKTDVEPQYD